MNQPNELLTQHQLERVFAKSALVESFRKSGLSIRAFAAEHGIPTSSLALTIRRSAKGMSGFLDRRTGNGRRSEIDDRSLTWVLAFLAARRRATITAAWRELQPIAVARGWRYPTYGQLNRAISNLPADARELMVHGSRHLFESWGLVQRKETNAPNEMWQIDATQLGVWVLDMDSGELIQPWAIGIIDTHSRVIMGFHLTRTAPTSAEVLLAVRTAILPKHEAARPFYGIPKKIQSDNGAIFRSGDFLDALMRLEIGLVEIPKDCPSANGKIERVFRTVGDQFLRSLEGYAHQHRGLASASRHAVPWPLLPKLAAKFVDAYHLRVHRSLDKTPWEAWHDALIDAPGLNFTVPEIVEACKMRVERVVYRDGIEIAPGSHLSAPELAGLVGQRVTVRLLPEGGDTSAECFYRGDYLARLSLVEGNGELAEAIKAARLDRARELARLRKQLLKAADRMLEDRSTGKPKRKGTKAENAGKGSGDEDDQGFEIPDFKRDEDEE